MPTLIIELTDVEYNALTTVCSSVEGWGENALKNRARIAIDEIVKICVEKCLENSISIPNSKDEMVSLVIQKQWISNFTDEPLK